METNISPGTSKTLRGILREWAVNTHPPPQFQAQVWERIARAEARRTLVRWPSLWQWLRTGWIRPAWAYSYIVVLLLLGTLGGYWQATEKMTREKALQRARYVQAIDPYQMPRP
jgi:hypothetical protein